jgi:hypothetical protein
VMQVLTHRGAHLQNATELGEFTTMLALVSAGLGSVCCRPMPAAHYLPMSSPGRWNCRATGQRPGWHGPSSTAQ